MITLRNEIRDLLAIMLSKADVALILDYLNRKPIFQSRDVFETWSDDSMQLGDRRFYRNQDESGNSIYFYGIKDVDETVEFLKHIDYPDDEAVTLIEDSLFFFLYYNLSLKKDPEISDYFNTLIKKSDIGEEWIMPSRSSSVLSRSDIIQGFIDRFEYKSYLEVGLAQLENFNKIRCKNKAGIDPAKNNFNKCNLSQREKIDLFHQKSDDFFRENNEMYDIIFIDGFHEHQQCRRDVENSLKFLNTSGTIIMHDLNPGHFISQKFPPKSNGDVWKTFAELRTTRQELEMFTICTDQGVGVIRRGDQTIYADPDFELSYEYFDKNRVKLMNMISIKDFLEMMEMSSSD